MNNFLIKIVDITLVFFSFVREWQRKWPGSKGDANIDQEVILKFLRATNIYSTVLYPVSVEKVLLQLLLIYCPEENSMIVLKQRRDPCRYYIVFI